MPDTIEIKPAAKYLRKMAREPQAESHQLTTPASKPLTAKEASGQHASKIGLVLELLSRADGATIEQIVEATGWLTHTTRAALTGLRKKGHVIISEKREGASRVYRVEAV
ncbi:DUF3489 domain-containing protein [Sphingobium sp. LMC3-1-1.1]|uniref:DUF3489 domain-containing protein n=1 Tax=Sphingobium sp. LMC3-1-1.1 TaxID=3135241 RepID=UPI00342BEF69